MGISSASFEGNMNAIEGTSNYVAIRAEVRKLCGKFPDEYHQALAVALARQRTRR
jgi:hypothetical protein